MSSDVVTKNLAGCDISGKNLNGRTFYNVSFKGSNLSGARLEDSIFCGCDFSGANLLNTVIRLNCNFFKDNKFDTTQMKMLLYLIVQADVDSYYKERIKNLLGGTTISRFDKFFRQEVY